MLLAALSMSQTVDKSAVLARIFVQATRGVVSRELFESGPEAMRQAWARSSSVDARVRERNALALARRGLWAAHAATSVEPVNRVLLVSSLGERERMSVADAPCDYRKRVKLVLRAAASADAVLLFVNVAAHDAQFGDKAQAEFRRELMPLVVALRVQLAAVKLEQIRIILVLCGFDEASDAPPPNVADQIRLFDESLRTVLTRVRCVEPLAALVVPVSSITGENVCERTGGPLFGSVFSGPSLLEAIHMRAAPLLDRTALRADEKPRFMVIQSSVTPDNRQCMHGRLLTGGELRCGADIVLLPHELNRAVRVDEIRVHGVNVSKIVPGDVATLVTKPLGVRRRLNSGIASTPQGLVPVREFTAEVLVSHSFIRLHSNVLVQVGPQRVPCTVLSIRTLFGAAEKELTAMQRSALGVGGTSGAARGDAAVVAFLPLSPLFVEPERVSRATGRIVIQRDASSTCHAVGRVLSTMPWPFDAETKMQLSTTRLTFDLIAHRLGADPKRWDYFAWHSWPRRVASESETRDRRNLLLKDPAPPQSSTPLLFDPIPGAVEIVHALSTTWTFVGVVRCDGGRIDVICERSVNALVPDVPESRTLTRFSVPRTKPAEYRRIDASHVHSFYDVLGRSVLAVALLQNPRAVADLLELGSAPVADVAAIVIDLALFGTADKSVAPAVRAHQAVDRLLEHSLPISAGVAQGNRGLLDMLFKAVVQENNVSELADCVRLMLEHGVSANAGGVSRFSALERAVVAKFPLEVIDALLRHGARVWPAIVLLALEHSLTNTFILFLLRGARQPPCLSTTNNAKLEQLLRKLPSIQPLLRASSGDKLLVTSFEAALHTGADHVVAVPHENDSVAISTQLVRLLHPTFKPLADVSPGVSALPTRYSAADFRLFVRVLVLGNGDIKSACALGTTDSPVAWVAARKRLRELTAVYLVGVRAPAVDAPPDDPAFEAEIAALTGESRTIFHRVATRCSSLFESNPLDSEAWLARPLRTLLFHANRDSMASEASLQPESLRRSRQLAASVALDSGFADDELTTRAEPEAAALVAAHAIPPDVVLVTGTRRVNAHRLVLSLRVPYFRARFNSGMGDANAREVALDDVSSEAMRVLVQFAYTGTARIAADHIIDALECAHRLNFVELQRYCELLLAQNLEPDNVCDILPHAVLYDAPILREACLWYITLMSAASDRGLWTSVYAALESLNDPQLVREVNHRKAQLNTL
jgi:translation elongation factor EF-1alpha